MDSSFGLGFVQNDSWVPEGSIQRASILQDYIEYVWLFHYLVSEETWSDIHDIMLVEAFQASPDSRRRGIKLTSNNLWPCFKTASIALCSKNMFKCYTKSCSLIPVCVSYISPYLYFQPFYIFVLSFLKVRYYWFFVHSILETLSFDYLNLI